MNKKTFSMAVLFLLGFVTVVDAQSRRSSGGDVGIIIGVIIGVIVLFLVCRELICWYYKINSLVALMEEQNSLLRELLGKNNQISTNNENSGLSQGSVSGYGKNSSSGINLSNPPSVNKNYSNTWVCKKCNEENPVTSSLCKGCGEYK